jgi:5-methylcytosine-specific restriction endonuclease McrA
MPNGRLRSGIRVFDHIVALADIPDKDLKWWKLENLCSRCVKCHQIKSSAENLARRLKKRFKAG